MGFFLEKAQQLQSKKLRLIFAFFLELPLSCSTFPIEDNISRLDFNLNDCSRLMKLDTFISASRLDLYKAIK